MEHIQVPQKKVILRSRSNHTDKTLRLDARGPGLALLLPGNCWALGDQPLQLSGPQFLLQDTGIWSPQEEEEVLCCLCGRPASAAATSGASGGCLEGLSQPSHSHPPEAALQSPHQRFPLPRHPR